MPPKLCLGCFYIIYFKYSKNIKQKFVIIYSGTSIYIVCQIVLKHSYAKSYFNLY